jgi:hypothetical protein
MTTISNSTFVLSNGLYSAIAIPNPVSEPLLENGRRPISSHTQAVRLVSSMWIDRGKFLVTDARVHCGISGRLERHPVISAII